MLKSLLFAEGEKKASCCIMAMARRCRCTVRCFAVGFRAFNGLYLVPNPLSAQHFSAVAATIHSIDS